MGLYNVIRSGQGCPKCGAAVEWQSKELEYSGLLLANVMETIELRPGMDGEMHAVCDVCRVWLDAGIHDGRVLEIGVRRLEPAKVAEPQPAEWGREED